MSIMRNRFVVAMSDRLGKVFLPQHSRRLLLALLLLAGSTGKASAPVPRPASVPPPCPPTAEALAAEGARPRTTSATIVAMMVYEQPAGTALEKNICVACVHHIHHF